MASADSGATRASGKGRPLTRLQVLRIERLTPHMVRVIGGGDGLAAFAGTEFTDGYVKLVFGPPGVRYPDPFDLQTIRAELPAEQWPRTRTYTIRHFDREAEELALDIVHHGDEGLTGPWLSGLRPGDELCLLGPGGAYAPRPEADWHLLAGDESALPAIAASLEAMPAGAQARVFVLVEDRSEEQPLVSKADVQVHWLHRAEGGDLAAAVRGMDFEPGVVQCFVHGEAGFVRDLRRHLLLERGVGKDLLSISGYWRLGKDDEGWRKEKAAERAAEEAVG